MTNSLNIIEAQVISCHIETKYASIIQIKLLLQISKPLIHKIVHSKICTLNINSKLTEGK
jgi:hypothetical protein